MIPVSSREREKDKYSITVVFFVCFIFFSMLAKLCKLKKKKIDKEKTVNLVWRDLKLKASFSSYILLTLMYCHFPGFFLFLVSFWVPKTLFDS